MHHKIKIRHKSGAVVSVTVTCSDDPLAQHVVRKISELFPSSESHPVWDDKDLNALYNILNGKEPWEI